MNTGDIAIDHFGRVRRLLAMSIEGLSIEQLMKQPDEESNPLGWIGWHLARIQDNGLVRSRPTRAGVGCGRLA